MTSKTIAVINSSPGFEDWLIRLIIFVETPVVLMNDTTPRIATNRKYDPRMVCGNNCVYAITPKKLTNCPTDANPPVPKICLTIVRSENGDISTIAN
jgi:hypothetical protein